MRRVVLIALVVLGLLLGCEQVKPSTTLTFKPLFDGKAITCQTAIDNDWQVSQLYLFLSQFQWQDNQGQWHELPLKTNPYQHSGIALLGMDCPGAEQANWQLQLNEVAANDIRALRAEIGVPFALNHRNPLTQPSPLNVPNMFWVWQTGHKFVRFELTSPTDNWVFHLGSTGCSSASALRSPSTQCKHPNRVSMQWSEINNGNINVDIGAWFHDIKFTDKTSCQSSRSNEFCQVIFNNMALK